MLVYFPSPIFKYVYPSRCLHYLYGIVMCEFEVASNSITLFRNFAKKKKIGTLGLKFESYTLRTTRL